MKKNRFVEDSDNLEWKYSKITPEEKKRSEKAMKKFYDPDKGKPRDSVESAPIDNRQVK